MLYVQIVYQITEITKKVIEVLLNILFKNSENTMILHTHELIMLW